MGKTELLAKGMIPEYITVEEATKLDTHLSAESIIFDADRENIKSKKLDTGEYLVNTLDLLFILRRSDKLFSQEQRLRRLGYLKRLKIIM